MQNAIEKKVEKSILIWLVFIPNLALSQNLEFEKELNVQDLSFYNEDSLQIQLKTFEGSYLYIDFWFRGCKPCIEQFPFSEQLESKLNRQPIKFINISFDQSYGEWINAIAEHHPTGLNLWIGPDENRKLLTSTYGITFFPKYWLVDEKGNVINPSTGRPEMYLKNEFQFYDRLIENLMTLQKKESSQ